MGVSADEHPLLVSNVKGDMVQGNEESTDQLDKSSNNESLWKQVSETEAQAKRSRCPTVPKKLQKNGRQGGRSKRTRRILMKRRARVEGSTRRSGYGIERRVRTLKKLIPNSESMGLDGLFRETADYILSLQMRVKLMQIMVKELAGSDDQ